MTEMSAPGFNKYHTTKTNLWHYISHHGPLRTVWKGNEIYHLCVAETMFGKIRHRFRGNNGFSRKYEKFIHM